MRYSIILVVYNGKGNNYFHFLYLCIPNIRTFHINTKPLPSPNPISSLMACASSILTKNPEILTLSRNLSEIQFIAISFFSPSPNKNISLRAKNSILIVQRSRLSKSPNKVLSSKKDTKPLKNHSNPNWNN